MIEIRGQTYERIGRVPYVKADGSTTRLTVLRSHCAKCGEPFEFTATDENIGRGMVNRRCAEHKRPGVKVRAKAVRR